MVRAGHHNLHKLLGLESTRGVSSASHAYWNCNQREIICGNDM